MYRSLRQFDQHNINHHTKRSAETRIESWTNTSGLKYGKFFFLVFQSPHCHRLGKWMIYQHPRIPANLWKRVEGKAHL